MAGKIRTDATLPTRAEILAFIEEHQGKAGKREIARAFGLRGSDKIWLKQMLRELAYDGAIERRRGRRLTRAGALPSVAVIEVVDTDPDGELLARPVRWSDETSPPRIYLDGGSVRGPALGIGDRVLARLTRTDQNNYVARIMRRIQTAPDRMLGVYSAVGTDGRVQPTDRRMKHDLVIRRENARGAKSGDLVVAEPLPGRPLGLSEARIVEILGDTDNPRTLSLIAIHEHGIPTEFPPAAIAEAAAAKPVRLGTRVDLRDLPLVTIDPADARDRDDAVWAAPDDAPDNSDGWQVIVAIADVAHYVRTGSALDEEAQRRGNSAYFPDRVVPMLPEALCNKLCSLEPGKSRPVLAVAMRFDAVGNKLDHRFMRAQIKSVAGLSYGQVQQAADGNPDTACQALLDRVIEPLYGAYRALAAARVRRAPLSIELPERQVVLGDDGRIDSIHRRARHDSHRLIEEIMIAANIAAAESLEAAKRPCMYRVHEDPPHDKIESLRDFLASLDIPFAKGQVIRPAAFNRVIEQVAGSEREHLINQVVLRTQTQAYYSPDNLGHFGLSLARYAHFTSPIRRYADLLVHRSLITALNLGSGGLAAANALEFAPLGEQISNCERRAMAAERDAMDRYMAAFMASRVGAIFAGRISGVTRFGLFVTLDETGADGLVPIRRLGAEYFTHEEDRHVLVGQRTGTSYRLGDPVEVRLTEAAPVTGGLVLELVGATADRQPAPGHRSPGGKPKKPGRKTAKKTRRHGRP